MVRVNWNVVDYVEKPNPIDYSELVTEPGLVLSMREIYERYAAQGINLLDGELIPDDDADEDIYDPEVEEPVDYLHAAASMRASSTRPRGKRSASKPEDSEESKTQTSSEKPKQSEGDDATKDED